MRVQMADIDLAEELRALAFDFRYDFLRVLVCEDGTPLGEIYFSANDYVGEVPVERLQAEITRTFAWPRWRLSIERELDPVANPSALAGVTVAVCTKDRPESLKRCLAALRSIDYPMYEVLVVDNASSDANVSAIAAGAGLRCVREPRVGLNWARNAAVEHAAYELVAFCDDDVQVSPRWLYGIARGFRDPRTAVVTGLVLPAELETPWQWEFERYGGMGKGYNRFSVDRALIRDCDLFTSARWGVGANMAFRRSVLRDVGMFDVGLDVGTPSGGGGDIEMLWRVVDAGHRLRYEPDAWVRHAHRRDRDSLIRQIEANGRSYGCFLRTLAERDPSMSEAVARSERAWVKGWLLRQVALKTRHRDRFGLTLALAELRGARGAAAAYRTTRLSAPLSTMAKS